eukprot:gene27053-34943_t
MVNQILNEVEPLSGKNGCLGSELEQHGEESMELFDLDPKPLGVLCTYLCETIAMYKIFLRCCKYKLMFDVDVAEVVVGRRREEGQSSTCFLKLYYGNLSAFLHKLITPLLWTTVSLCEVVSEMEGSGIDRGLQLFAAATVAIAVLSKFGTSLSHKKGAKSFSKSADKKGSFLLKTPAEMSAAAKAAASTGVAVGSDTNTKVGKELISLRDKQMGPNVSVFYKQDGGLVITSGSGVFMRDIDGNLHLDCCNNVACVGHAHPNVVRAGQQELANIQTNGRFLNPIQQRYVTKLLETFPPELNTVYLVNSGSEANDLALRIARAHTKAARPQDVIVLDSAYHGHTQAIVDISPYKWYQAIDGKNYQPSTTHVAELPDGFR